MDFSTLVGIADLQVRQLLGQVITYSPSVGSPVEVQGVFDALYVKVEVGLAGVSSCGPAVFLRLEDLPSDPSDDSATVTVGGLEYSIKEALPDGLGAVRLFLQRV